MEVERRVGRREVHLWEEEPFVKECRFSDPLTKSLCKFEYDQLASLRIVYGWQGFLQNKERCCLSFSCEPPDSIPKVEELLL